MQQHFRFRCILLVALQNDEGEITLLAKMTKMLSGNGFWIGNVEALAYNYSKEVSGCAVNRPLNIIFYGNTSRPKDLLQVSEWSGPVWIMFVNNTSPANEVLSEIFLPLDAEFLTAVPLNFTLVNLIEAYSILPGSELHWGKFGSWSSEFGLEITSSSLYQRRHNLQGIVLDAVTTDNPPFTQVNDPGPLVTIHSFVGKVWSALEHSMNFSTKIYRSSVFMGRGGRREDGRWKTMVDVVSRQEVHFGVDVFTVTKARAQKVDFTMPLISERYGIFIRRPDNMEIEWRKYITPLSPTTWIAVGGVLLLLAVTLATAQRLEEDPDVFTLPNCIFLVYGLFCQQGSDVLPQSFAGRISFYTACVLSVLLLASYSATLISFVSVQTNRLPFRDLRGLLHSRSYQFGVLDKTAEYDYYKNSKDPFLQELWNKVMAVNEANFPPSKMEGLQRVCEKRFAFYQQVDVIRFLRPNLTCDVVMLPGEREKIPFAFILGKGSPYKSFFNHRLLLMREVGILNKFLRQLSFVTGGTTSRDEFVSVDLSDVSPILVMLAASIVLSLLVLLAEILASKKLAFGVVALHSKGGCRRSDVSRNFYKRNRFVKHRSGMLFHFSPSFKMRYDMSIGGSKIWTYIRRR